MSRDDLLKVQEHVNDAYENVFIYTQEQMREMLLLISLTIEKIVNDSQAS